MSQQLLALTILGMGIITYGIRVSFFLLPTGVTLPAWFRRALRYVPAAVLSAIIFPELFMPRGVFDLSLDNSRLLAGLLAVVIAWRTRNALLTVAGGMIALWLLLTLKAG